VNQAGHILNTAALYSTKKKRVPPELKGESQVQIREEKESLEKGRTGKKDYPTDQRNRSRRTRDHLVDVGDEKSRAAQTSPRKRKVKVESRAEKNKTSIIHKPIARNAQRKTTRSSQEQKKKGYFPPLTESRGVPFGGRRHSEKPEAGRGRGEFSKEKEGDDR